MRAPAPEPGAGDRFARKREAVLAVASRLFNERGVRGVTLADVAERFGLAKNSITYYYPRKEDLAAACLLHTIEVCTDLVRRAEALPTPGERIRELVRLHLALHAAIRAGTHPPVMAFRDIRALTEPAAGAVFEGYTAMFRRVRALLKGPGAPRLRADELNARTHLLMSLVNRLPQMTQPHDDAEAQQALQRIMDVLLGGVQGAGARWRDGGSERQWTLGVREDTPAESFLHAATALINEQGYRGASVDRISERLQLTKGAFYYYNATKDDLVEQCFDRSFRIMRTALGLAEQVPGPGWEQVCCAVRGLLRFQVSAAGPLLRTTAYSALPDPERRTRVAEAFGRMREKVTGMVVQGMVDGSLRSVDAFFCGYHLLNSIDAAAEVQRWVRGASEESVAGLYGRPLLLGLLCEPAEAGGDPGKAALSPAHP